jgi:hypothetical protein
MKRQCLDRIKISFDALTSNSKKKEFMRSRETGPVPRRAALTHSSALHSPALFGLLPLAGLPPL